MYTGYSSVTTSDIPASAPVVFAYSNPPYAQVEEVKRRCPHARIVTIATHLDVKADMYDFENGAIPVADAVTVLRDHLASGQSRPIAYAALDDLQTIMTEFTSKVGNHERVRWLPAHFTDSPELPSWADGVQWSEKALGRNLNEYLLRSDFFGTVEPAPDKIITVSVKVNLTTGKVVAVDDGTKS